MVNPLIDAPNTSILHQLNSLFLPRDHHRSQTLCRTRKFPVPKVLRLLDAAGPAHDHLGRMSAKSEAKNYATVLVPPLVRRVLVGKNPAELHVAPLAILNVQDDGDPYSVGGVTVARELESDETVEDGTRGRSVLEKESVAITVRYH